MKLTLTELNIFIFCLLNAVAINIGVAQNTPLNSLSVQDSLQIKNDDDILKTPFGVFNLSKTTGAVFRVSGDELRKTAGDNLSEALRGRVPGLRIVRQTNTPGVDGGYAYILNGGTPYILIDGQPRGLQVDLREVEEVLVFNDGTFSSMLGTLGNNGLIYVVTRGGKLGKPTVEVNYQRGLNFATRLPKLLSAEDYATVINQAANNDGLADIYSTEAIAAYANGSDPIRYPNVNAQDVFLEDTSPSNFASLSVYGGKDEVSYGAFVGYSDWRGLEKVGQQIKGRNITFRTKIKARMNDFIETHASVYGKFGENERPVIGADQMFNWISSTPANAFPLKVGDSAYVVSNQFDTNTLSELEAGGNRTDYTANMVFDLGLDFDFEKYVPGLKYETYVMMRTFNSQVLQTNNTPELYTREYLQDQAGNDSLNLKLFRNEFLDLNVGRNGSGITRVFSYGGNFSYVKKMKEGLLNLNFNHLLYHEPNRWAGQPDINNLILNLNGSSTITARWPITESKRENPSEAATTKFVKAFALTPGFAIV